ncbi:hypothetical protein UC8_54030 [Roseimaritima ulvae]|uniref:DUF368 domain-containing protein n=1 Tax=Roseimaritima ulvae TaxID=980254 RepID=A0A5B9R1R6_9BACT|nr:hypothetical protein UC8_54030 [Roseimaritima ulvae]
MVVGCWLLVVGCWLLVVGCWLLAVGCWLLAVGWWLVVGGWWLVVGRKGQADKSQISNLKSQISNLKSQISNLKSQENPVPDSPPPPSPVAATWTADIVNVLRGYLMGAADTVPGVSGGTVALILGHYQRLVTAISHFDSTALHMLRQRQLRAAAVHCDLRFLIALGIGVATGILTLASLMHWLLDHRMPETLSVFFGLVLASSMIVAQQIRRWSAGSITLGLLAVVSAYALCSLTPTATEPSLGFIFLAAMIAICAMILPGISGAFILLLLGVYQPITGLIKDLAHGQLTTDALIKLSTFALGCALGLALFSRLLRWLLARYRDPTFAVLLGLMLGSLRRLWPLQQATPETLDAKFSQRQWVLVSPADWPGSLWLLLGLALAACVGVLVFEQLGRRLSQHEERP